MAEPLQGLEDTQHTTIDPAGPRAPGVPISVRPWSNAPDDNHASRKVAPAVLQVLRDRSAVISFSQHAVRLPGKT